MPLSEGVPTKEKAK